MHIPLNKRKDHPIYWGDLPLLQIYLTYIACSIPWHGFSWFNKFVPWNQNSKALDALCVKYHTTFSSTDKNNQWLGQPCRNKLNPSFRHIISCTSLTPLPTRSWSHPSSSVFIVFLLHSMTRTVHNLKSTHKNDSHLTVSSASQMNLVYNTMSSVLVNLLSHWISGKESWVIKFAQCSLF